VSLLETQKLRKYFGEVHAVDDVDFAVDPGEARDSIRASKSSMATSFSASTSFSNPSSN